jgi:hypothetical protein
VSVARINLDADDAERMLAQLEKKGLQRRIFEEAAEDFIALSEGREPPSRETARSAPPESAIGSRKGRRDV